MSSLINGPFPDVAQWIPEQFALSIKVNLNDIYDAIDRASLLTSEAEKNTIKLEIKGNTAIISSNIPEIGNVTEQVHILSENSNDFIIAFSSKYMMDAIKAINYIKLDTKPNASGLLHRGGTIIGTSNSPNVFNYKCVNENGEVQPIIIRNPEDENLTQLIVPIKIY